MKEQNNMLINELLILNPGLDVEIAKRFIDEEISKLSTIEVIPPYSGRTVQLIVDRAHTSLSKYFAVRE